MWCDVRGWGSCWLVVVALLAVSWGAAGKAAEGPELTFFAWTDQHIQTDGDGSHLLPAIDAMNALPGTPFPEWVGGEVAEPAFVIGCGDITEWPTTAARNTYDRLLTHRLRFPAYDVLGNHDDGGKVPSETMKRWLIDRHGGLSYTFDHGGVHFIALYSEYDAHLDNPAQPVHDDALAYLRDRLAELPAETPVIVAMHLCYDAITNRDAFVDALAGGRVLMVLGGHYHRMKIDQYRDIHFVQVPSPAPNGTPEVLVVRITPDRVVAVPYDYREDRWNENRRQILDVPLPAVPE